MLTNAIRICEAKFGNFLLYENGGFRHVMLHGAPPAYSEGGMQKDPVLYPKPGHNLDRVAQDQAGLVHVPDLMGASRPIRWGGSDRSPARARCWLFQCSRTAN